MVSDDEVPNLPTTPPKLPDPEHVVIVPLRVMSSIDEEVSSSPAIYPDVDPPEKAVPVSNVASIS